MTISRLTAMLIQNNEVEVCGGGPAKFNSEHPEWQGKYAGFVMMMDRSPSGCCRPRMLLSTDPIYETEQAAQQAMKEVVDTIRNPVQIGQTN